MSTDTDIDLTLDRLQTNLENNRCLRRQRVKRTDTYPNELSRGVYQGIEWFVGHNDLGHRTGYIKLSKSHPWFGKTTDQLSHLDVHGGVTWADKGPPGAVPRYASVWWIGFDCAHAHDLADINLVPDDVVQQWAELKRLSNGMCDTQKLLCGPNAMDDLLGGHVRSTEYVEKECERLAYQARNVDQLVAVDEHVIVGTLH